MSDIILAFDSSNSSCSVCVARGVKILAYEEELRPSMQAERLIQMIESVLTKASVSYDKLGYLAATIGPGSFTGIRIGLAAARGILLAAPHIQEIAITNFEAYAYRARIEAPNIEKVVVLINAYRNQLYMQEFDSKNGLGKYSLIDNDDAVELLLSKKENIICAGSGLEVIYHRIKNQQNLILLPRFPVLKARHFALLAHEMIRKKKFPKIEPLYIRAPDAKVAEKKF